MEQSLRIQMFFTALSLAFGFLHMVLWGVMPRLWNDLRYALFLLLMGLVTFADFQTVLVDDPGVAFTYQRIQRGALAVSFIFGFRFLFEVLLEEVPRRYRYLSIALVCTGILAVMDPIWSFLPLQITILIGLLLCFRSFLIAWRQERTDVLPISIGAIVFTVFASYDYLLDFDLISPVFGITNAYQFGLVGFYAGTSLYLARNIARTNIRSLERDRLKAELDQARELQLSMLPASLPDTSHVTASALIKTATEVGGDYYDVKVHDDDTVTFAVGDATGHGIRAGLMVAMMKSMFQGIGSTDDLALFFRSSAEIIKASHLGNLFMGLTLIRVRDRSVEIAAAGMPHVMIYRASTDTVEEAQIKTMPLGAFPSFPYHSEHHSFQTGDIILAFSDGLPELFNEKGEQLGTESIAHFLRYSAMEETPHETIEELDYFLDRWQNLEPLRDDLTVLVIKHK